MSSTDSVDLLVITQFFPPESMGGAHRWERITKNLDSSVEPHVLCTHPTFPFGEFNRNWRPMQTEKMDGTPVTRLFTYQPNSDTSVGRILNYSVFSIMSSFYVLFNFWKYDYVVTVSAPHTTFIPGLIANLTGRRWVIDIFDLWVDNAADLGYVNRESFLYRTVDWIERVSFSLSDGVFVITETMGEYYEYKYPDLEMDIYIVPFGVDTDLFHPDVNPVESVDVVYTGNLGSGQAFEPFLEAFASLEDKYEILIVGEGERREELENLVRELDASDRVRFQGYRPRREIPALLSGAKVSLVPLKTEYQLDYAMPTKLLETMATGTPYIASNVDEISRLTSEHQTGIAVKNDPEEIRTEMQGLLTTSEKRSRMGENAIDVVKSNHDWDSIGNKVSNIVNCGA